MGQSVKKPRPPHYFRNLLLIGMGELLLLALITAYVILPVRDALSMSHPGRAPLTGHTPADLGFAYRDVSFQTSDGLTLRGWFVPGSNHAAVIVAHALGGNRESMLDRAAVLVRHGYSVLLFDLRAHGVSDGSQISFAGTDILAALDFLKSQPEVDPWRIGALGSSLGSMVVVQAAAASPDIKAVVLDSGALADFADEPPAVSVAHFLDLPYQWVSFQVWKWRGVSAPIPMVRALPRISPRPVLLISGAASELEHGMMRNYYAAALEPKALWEVPEAGHTWAFTARPQEYEDRVVEFFDRSLR